MINWLRNVAFSGFHFTNKLLEGHTALVGASSWQHAALCSFKILIPFPFLFWVQRYTLSGNKHKDNLKPQHGRNIYGHFDIFVKQIWSKESLGSPFAFFGELRQIINDFMGMILFESQRSLPDINSVNFKQTDTWRAFFSQLDNR